MKKVLLISANMMRMPYPVYPLGLDYVAGSLSSRYQIKIADLNEFASPDQLETLILDYLPDYIGVSIRNIDNTDTINSRGFLADYQSLIDRIRKKSRATIILGGSGFTIFPVEFMQALDVDYGIAGEGERFPLLLETTHAVYQPWDGHIQRRFDPDSAHTKFYLSYGGMLNLQTKRGCPFRCSYCTYPHIEGRNMRLFDPKVIAREARELQDAGAKYIFMTDSAFNADYGHSRQVAEALIEARLSIPWGGFFAPTLPPVDYYKILADAGLTHVEFGTESLSDIMLTNLRKPFAVHDVFAAQRYAQEAGHNVAHYFLLGGPGENPSTLQETLSHVDQLNNAVFFFFCGIRIYPHTALYDVALQEGQISADQNLLQPVFYRSPCITDIEIMNTVEKHADGRFNWLIGAGETKATRVLPKLFERGHTGPLWEHLIQ
jgi:radical SAM superfamily enzyme YgiQ (UPF0313 family)